MKLKIISILYKYNFCVIFQFITKKIKSAFFYSNILKIKKKGQKYRSGLQTNGNGYW